LQYIDWKFCTDGDLFPYLLVETLQIAFRHESFSFGSDVQDDVGGPEGDDLVPADFTPV